MGFSNKEILIIANAAVTEGDHERFLSYCTDDVVWEFVGDRTLQGKLAVREYMAVTYIEPPKFMVEDLIAEGDLVTAIGTISLRAEDGEISDYSYCDVWRFNDGKMAALRAFVIANDN